MHDKNAYNNGERNMEKKKDMLEQHLAENFIELAKEEEQQINHIKNHGSEDDIRKWEGTKNYPCKAG